MASRPLVSVDWDGVLSRDPSWRPGGTFAAVDTALIDRLHAQGYAVAVCTCNEVRNVARALQGAGHEAYADEAMRHAGWGGGPDGRVVLVTGRKVAAVAYVDDRAVHWRYGGAVAEAMAAVAGRQAERRSERIRAGR